MENYIVRIYRRASDDSESIAGVVERPESGENISFRSHEEFINIFIPPESTISPNNKQQTIEQRKYRRFSLKNSTLIFDDTTDVGEVIDISLGGIAFYCPDIPEESKKPFKVGILCEGAEDYCTEKIDCKKLMVRDPELISFEPKKRYSIVFDELSSKLKMQMEHIIQNYSFCEV
jgi:hypothetical protein